MSPWYHFGVDGKEEGASLLVLNCPWDQEGCLTMASPDIKGCGIKLAVATGDRLMSFNILPSSHVDTQAWACSRSRS